MILTFQAMTSGPQQPQSLVQIRLVLIAIVLPPEVDRPLEQILDESRRRDDAEVFRGDVVFQAGPLVDGQLLPLVDGSSQSFVVLTGVDVVGVVLRVVDVLLGSVAAQAVAGDFELLGGVAEAHEAEDPEDDADCFS